MVVLDLYAPARFKEDYHYEWIAENIYGIISRNPIFFPQKPSEAYLRKIISYTGKKGIKLVLIVAPHIVIDEDMRTYNRIREINRDATDVKLVYRLAGLAGKYLRNVFVGNC